jgi:hypothetical protein
VPTCARLNPRQPLRVNYLMAVAAIPKGFDRVKSVAPGADGDSVTLAADSGRTVVVPLDLNFLEIANLRNKLVF